ncbi:amino acid permease [Verrucomicrobium sp. 3C]|uniref:amino acid permease n=1 Tax=Verrucomicrobium sp. 3C TaxID=1134055 RepID=UPI00068536A3|nr:amino acid permease [Verrucomicrobium sp. 3C]
MESQGGAGEQLPERREAPVGLHRTLTSLDLMLLGIGAIVGAGVFVLTGVAAATAAGPGLWLSFVVAGLACVFAALCYAEFASVVPTAGSAYAYASLSMGEFAGWLTGWNLILAYLLTGGVVAIGWSGYFQELLAGVGLSLPTALGKAPHEGGWLNLPAALIALGLSGILALGARESARFNHWIVVIKLLVIGLFLLVAMRHVNPQNWHPLLPFGWRGVMTGAALIFFAYVGFDAVSAAAEEAKNPQRDLPLGILGSLAVCTVVYILVGVVLTGIVPYRILNVKDPVAFALVQVGERVAADFVAVGAIAGITSALLVNLYGQSRVFFAMCRDGLLPGFLGRIHPISRTPARMILLIGALVAGIAGFLPIESVAELTNMGALAAFMVVALGVLVLRKKRPGLLRPFQVPFMPWSAMSAIGFCGYLMTNLSRKTFVCFLLWMFVGALVYLVLLWGRPGRPSHAALTRGTTDFENAVPHPEGIWFSTGLSRPQSGGGGFSGS